MRARLQALGILISIIGLIFFGYRYFYISNVSGVIIENTQNIPYTVEIRGNLSYRYFPMLDKAIYYRSTCIDSCIFEPIPPISYDITITGTGIQDIQHTISLTSGTREKYSVNLSPKLIITPLSSRLDDVTIDGAIGVGQDNDIFTLEALENGGYRIISSKSDTPIFVSPFAGGSPVLDMTHTAIILKNTRNETTLIDIDTRQSIIFPYDSPIISAKYLPTGWKVLTTDGLYESTSDTWIVNPRFTDYIDLSPRWRIGSISATDSEKLTLQNLPQDTDHILLLDRKTGEQKILITSRPIGAFFYYKNRPAILEKDGSISMIEYDTSLFE